MMDLLERQAAVFCQELLVQECATVLFAVCRFVDAMTGIWGFFGCWVSDGTGLKCIFGIE